MQLKLVGNTARICSCQRNGAAKHEEKNVEAFENRSLYIKVGMSVEGGRCTKHVFLNLNLILSFSELKNYRFGEEVNKVLFEVAKTD